MASEPAGPGLSEAELTISVDFTEAEIILLRRRAKDAGMSPTAFVRRAALGADPLAVEQTLQVAGAIGAEEGIRLRDVADLALPMAGLSVAGGEPGAGAEPEGSAEQISTAQAKAMLSGLIAGAERERTS